MADDTAAVRVNRAPGGAVFAEQIRLLLNNPVDVPANLINAGLVAVGVWKLYPVWMLASWLGVFCAVSLSRLVIRLRYARAPRDTNEASRWGRLFTLNAGAAGCLWGLTGSVVLMTPNPIYYDFVIFILGGTMAGGIVCTAAFLPAMFAFIVPIMLPAVLALLIHGGLLEIEMATMLALFAYALAWTGRSINRSIVDNVELRLGQEQLVAKLRASEAKLRSSEAQLRSSEAAMAEAQALAQVGSWEFNVQSGADVWSAETYRIFGVDPATFTPSRESTLARVHPDDRKALAADFAAVLAQRSATGTDHRLVMDDGSVKYVHELGRVTFDAAGIPLRMNGTTQDVTERHLAEQKLQLANVLLATQMEAALDGILVAGADRKIISYNTRMAAMWNITLEDLAAGSDEVVLARVTSAVKNPQQFLARVRYLYDHPGEDSHEELETTDGRYIDRYSVTLYNAAKVYLGRAWFFRDVTERKQAAEQALRLAHYDVLTGLANRAVFVEALQHEIAAAKRGGTSFAVLYLDLDHFKDVNDTLGHPIGDELLKAVADRLRSNTRANDTVARFGGDEFAVVVADTHGPADAAALADKLMATLSAPYLVRGIEVQSAASMGIALYGSEAPDAETLLSHADVALYRAKSDGRSRYRFFTEAMDSEVQARVKLEAELRIALDANQLFLMYQPQVATESRSITGVEALVRWRHPRRGVLGPDLFIPLAEQMGIIARIGHWVLWEACRQGKAWIDAGIAPKRISVNVSALQFKAPVALEADIAGALETTGLPPEMLELELTESVLMDASRDHRDVLQRLRKTGVTLAIDDFGTGYSSLEYLRRFPSNRIKIAQNFVTNLGSTPGDAAIVRATIGLARELGIDVIAEGVETKQQAELLKLWGCEEVQGFHFARPLDVEHATAMLRLGEIGSPAP